MKKIIIGLFALLMYNAANASVPPGTSWQWQLQGNIDTSVDASLFDIDLMDVKQSVIDTLHQKHKIVICYISAGTWEDWRQDADKFPSSVKGRRNGWPGERWIDIRNIDVIGPIMEARMDLAVSKHCDGIEPDNIDGYSNRTGFPLTYNDQITYNQWLAQKAHDRGLLVALKNDVEQIRDLEALFDFAINEECYSYNECDEYSAFINANKAVLGVEYHKGLKKFCPKANKANFDFMKKRERLNAWRKSCR